MNGQTEIDSINAILKLSRRFNWDNFSISYMIEFYQLCLKHGLRISHYPQERALEQFQITRANCEPDEVEAIYFTLVQIPVMTGLLKLLGEPQTQFKELEQRIIKMETLLTDAHKGVQTLVQQDEYLHYLQYFQQKIPVFTEYGIQLTIDEGRREAIYQNGSLYPIRYRVNRSGYYAALRALNHQKVRRKARQTEQGELSDDSITIGRKLAELIDRAENIGNCIYPPNNGRKEAYYIRQIRRLATGKNTWRCIFTNKDVLDPKHERGCNRFSWAFNVNTLEELEELELFIAHDEEIYNAEIREKGMS